MMSKAKKNTSTARDNAENTAGRSNRREEQRLKKMEERITTLETKVMSMETAEKKRKKSPPPKMDDGLFRWPKNKKEKENLLDKDLALMKNTQVFFLHFSMFSAVFCCLLLHFVVSEFRSIPLRFLVSAAQV